MIGVEAMIGAGIFELTGIAAGESGPASILALALNGDGTAYCLSPWRRAGTFKVEMETLPEVGSRPRSLEWPVAVSCRGSC